MQTKVSSRRSKQFPWRGPKSLRPGSRGSPGIKSVASGPRGPGGPWTGWALSSMPWFWVRAWRELLPKSGIPASTANIGIYGSLLFSLFLIGWGLALIWGPISDRYGRARTLMLTILCFSLFTLLSALATNVWTLAIFRLLAGVGIGGVL